MLSACVGFIMLYSAASGSFEPWAIKQMIRFGLGFVLMLCVALTPIHFWLRNAYFLYILCLILIVLVEIVGTVGMGARRWIDLGFVAVQPSEFMKIIIVLALARYFYASQLGDVKRLTHLVIPLVLVSVPVFFIIRQPDLGTALLLIASGVIIFFLAGVRVRVFIFSAIAGIAAIIPVWKYILHDYQKARLMTFLRPDQDLLGSGYHVMQSKIALGSGGVTGKGFLAGSQSHLSFLPEMHTDFIFTMLAEEFGFIGGVVLLSLYLSMVIYGFVIALKCKNQFGRLISMGVMNVFFLNYFVNIAMVMGLLPVVGMPLPLVSYGGTSLITHMFGIGLVLCVFVNRDINLRPGSAEIIS